MAAEFLQGMTRQTITVWKPAKVKSGKLVRESDTAPKVPPRPPARGPGPAAPPRVCSRYAPALCRGSALTPAPGAPTPPPW